MREDHLAVLPSKRPRSGGADAFRQMAEHGDDTLLDKGDLPPTKWEHRSRLVKRVGKIDETTTRSVLTILGEMFAPESSVTRVAAHAICDGLTSSQSEIFSAYFATTGAGEHRPNDALANRWTLGADAPLYESLSSLQLIRGGDRYYLSPTRVEERLLIAFTSPGLVCPQRAWLAHSRCTRHHRSMSRAARLLDLMQILRRRRGPVTGQTLSKELGISIRTLYRDISTLQAQGADIQGEPGLGYVLRPGFTMPPLMFSVDEIEAVVLGSRWVATRGDTRLRAAAENAIAKVRAVLPIVMREHVDAATLTVPKIPRELVTIDMSVIRDAIRTESKITLAYHDGKGQATHRTVWPLLIGFFDRVLLLAAWCELRRDYRAFRIDRIIAVDVTEMRFPRRRATMVEEWRQRQGIVTTAGS